MSATDSIGEEVEPAKPIAGTSRRRPSKRFSVIAAEGNPLAAFTAGAKAASGKSVAIKVENTSDARPISDTELGELTTKLKAFEDNADVINHIDAVKVSFLFTSADLIAILDCVTSLKTKLVIIESLAPRLTDPKKNQTELIEMFRFVTDREKVESILKARAQQLGSGMFRRTDSAGTSAASPPVKGASPGARPGAGRGLSGRGNGSFRLMYNGVDPASSLSSPVTSSLGSVFDAALSRSVAGLSVTSDQTINTITEGDAEDCDDGVVPTVV